MAIDFETHKRIKRKATKVLALLHNSKKNLIFPNVLEIEETLKNRDGKPVPYIKYIVSAV